MPAKVNPKKVPATKVAAAKPSKKVLAEPTESEAEESATSSEEVHDRASRRRTSTTGSAIEMTKSLGPQLEIESRTYDDVLDVFTFSTQDQQLKFKPAVFDKSIEEVEQREGKYDEAAPLGDVIGDRPRTHIDAIQRLDLIARSSTIPAIQMLTLDTGNLLTYLVHELLRTRLEAKMMEQEVQSLTATVKTMKGEIEAMSLTAARHATNATYSAILAAGPGSLPPSTGQFQLPRKVIDKNRAFKEAKESAENEPAATKKTGPEDPKKTLTSLFE